MHDRSLRRSAIAALATLVAQPALADPPAIVTDTPVAHSLVSMVTGDLAEPVLLLDAGADPHHFQLRPSQARAVAQADLVVWMGPALTPWMARAVEALADGAALELLETEGVRLQPFLESRLTGGAAPSDADEHGHVPDHDDHHDHAHDDHGHGHAQDDHEHDHDHARDDHDHHGHRHGDAHAHDHGDVDPHAWMDPHNAATWLGTIAAALAELDPENAATYRVNAAAGVERVAALEAEIARILAPAGAAGLVMYHDAYGYLASAFGLNVLGSIALGDAADPGAARLTAIRAHLREVGAVCVFPEVNHPDAYVTLVGEADAGLRVGRPLDPEGVMLEPGPDLYPALMREMATAIADCVAGD
jgi:zinc transport system substrate-binding protein